MRQLQPREGIVSTELCRPNSFGARFSYDHQFEWNIGIEMAAPMREAKKVDKRKAPMKGRIQRMMFPQDATVKFKYNRLYSCKRASSKNMSKTKCRACQGEQRTMPEMG